MFNLYEKIGNYFWNNPIYDNESDLYFLHTKRQCINKYYKACVEVLDQIIEEYNASKDGQEKFKLLSLTPESWEPRKLMKVFNTSEQGYLVKPDC